MIPDEISAKTPRQRWAASVVCLASDHDLPGSLSGNWHRVPFYGIIVTGMAVTADAGCFGETNVMLFEYALLAPYLATQKMKHGQALPPVRGRPPKDLTFKERRVENCTKFKSKTRKKTIGRQSEDYLILSFGKLRFHRLPGVEVRGFAGAPVWRDREYTGRPQCNHRLTISSEITHGMLSYIQFFQIFSKLFPHLRVL